MTNGEELKDKFTIQCKKCLSFNTGINFYSGCTWDGGGSTGSLIVYCGDCDNEVVGEDT